VPVLTCCGFNVLWTVVFGRAQARFEVEMETEILTEIIIGIGDGSEKSHNTRLQSREIKPQNQYLLRECPNCGREVLTARQKLCDKCKKKNRKKTYREAYYKKTRNG